MVPSKIVVFVDPFISGSTLQFLSGRNCLTYSCQDGQYDDWQLRTLSRSSRKGRLSLSFVDVTHFLMTSCTFTHGCQASFVFRRHCPPPSFSCMLSLSSSWKRNGKFSALVCIIFPADIWFLCLTISSIQYLSSSSPHVPRWQNFSLFKVLLFVCLLLMAACCTFVWLTWKREPLIKELSHGKQTKPLNLLVSLLILPLLPVDEAKFSVFFSYCTPNNLQPPWKIFFSAYTSYSRTSWENAHYITFTFFSILINNATIHVYNPKGVQHQILSIL